MRDREFQRTFAPALAGAGVTLAGASTDRDAAAGESRFLRALVPALIATSVAVADVTMEPAVLDAAWQFLAAQVAALPWPLRFGLSAGLLLFRLDVWAHHLTSFCALAPSQRVDAVQRWMESPIAPLRLVFGPLRSLAVLACYEAREGVRLEQPPAAQAGSPGLRAAGDTRASTPRATSPARASSGFRRERAGALVVGSGAGGAVTALELALHGHDVLMLEEGEDPGEPLSDAGATGTMARLYRHRGMTPILGHVPIAYVEGRCVGGSTEINSGFWHRPPLESVLRWRAQYDLACAGPEDLRPHWEWAERLLGVGLAEDGWPRSSEVFARGAQAMDWAVSEVPRTAARARTGRPGPDASRQPGPGMTRSLIPRAIEAGVRLMPRCRVEHLETRGARVTAAIVRHRRADGTTERIRVEPDHLFVCAGATETPALLRRSGVTANVGNSLRIHPMLKVAALFADEVGSGPATIPLLQVKEFWPEIVLGGAFFSPGHLAVVLAENWRENREKMDSLSRMACYYVGVRGTGCGQVRPSRLEPDRAVIRYELSGEDMWNLSRGLARLAMLLLEGGALEVLPAVRGLRSIRNEVDAVHWLDDRLDGRACSLNTVHAFSTCPIGERRDRCAANSFGRLNGMENLYVNDASMIPDSPGVNPQGTIMTFARRNVLHFCDEHPA